MARDRQHQPKSISSSVIKALEKYHWPGNVRELENVVQRAVVMAKGEVILPGDLPPEIANPGSHATSSAPLTGGEGAPTEMVSVARMLFRWARQDPKLKVLPAVERELIIHALQETKGNQVHAAKLLGITRATLRKRVEKFKIKRELNIQ
jgi:two-component system nitrogen regulation response regulator GlnG